MNPLGKALLGLHAWGSMVFSWLLIPVFITGSIAVFEPEISYWMRSDGTISSYDWSDPVDTAETRLREVGAGHPFWRIRLPNSREPHIEIAWGKNVRDSQDEFLHPLTGEPMPTRQSAGGHFFTHFHADLWLGRPGRWIVGAAGIFMLAALVSGLLIHHRIFKDFFTMRPQSGKRRAWLDIHNLFGIATLPFMLMITYTGVVILSETFVPAATYALYDGNPRASRADAVRSFERKANGTRADSLPLPAHFAAAEKILGEGNISSLTVRHPGDGNAVVQTARHVEDRLAAVADHVSFDAVTGEELARQTQWNAMVYAFRAQVGLHLAHFGGAPVRWLYFLSGLLGAAMMAAGTVLLLRKRRQRHGNDRWQRWLEAMGAASISGALLASLAYFWANRLFPAAIPGRDSLEVAAFFTVWGLALLHALIRGKQAWREQIMAAALLFILLAAFDAIARGFGDVVRRSIDLTFLASGILLTVCGNRIFRRGEAL